MPAWQWLLIILVVLLVILAITTIISAIFSWLFGVLGVVITAIVIAKWCFGKTIALSPRNGYCHRQVVLRQNHRTIAAQLCRERAAHACHSQSRRVHTYPPGGSKPGRYSGLEARQQSVR